MGGVLLEMGEAVTKGKFQTVGLFEKGVNREVLRCCNYQERNHISRLNDTLFFLFTATDCSIQFQGPITKYRLYRLE